MANNKKYEVERKFLLKCLPDIKYKKIILIHQYYLENEDAFSDRVRKTEDGEKITYFRTQKYRKSERAQEEVEDEISEKEFKKLRKTAHSEIIKYRHIIEDNNYTWEIDSFDNIDLVIGEIEIVTDDDHLESVIKEINGFPTPTFISKNLIMEVSDLKPFSNKRLAVPLK